MIDYYKFLEEVTKDLANHDLPDSLSYIIMAHTDITEQHKFNKEMFTAQGDYKQVLVLMAMFIENLTERYELKAEQILDHLAMMLDVYVPEDQRGEQWEDDDQSR